jgi:hypothetical protein
MSKPYLCETCGMWHLGRAWKRGVDEWCKVVIVIA